MSDNKEDTKETSKLVKTADVMKHHSDTLRYVARVLDGISEWADKAADESRIEDHQSTKGYVYTKLEPGEIQEFISQAGRSQGMLMVLGLLKRDIDELMVKMFPKPNLGSDKAMADALSKMLLEALKVFEGRPKSAVLTHGPDSPEAEAERQADTLGGFNMPKGSA